MSDYFDRIERQIVSRVETARRQRPRPRLRLDLALPVVGAIVVVAIALMFLGLHHAPSTASRPAGAVTLVYRAQPTRRTPVLTRAAVAREMTVMHARIDALGVAPVSFRVTGDLITVRLPASANLQQTERALETPPTVAFYDWEANVLTPSGKPVATALRASDAAATVISQGSGAAAPGTPGVGSMTLYDAVKLAARQPLDASPDNTRPGSQYYLFAAPNSRACALAAKDARTPAIASAHCLLSGPADSVADLNAGRPPGIGASQGLIFVIRRGTIILQAASPAALGAAGARYYVLKDHAALLGTELTHPQPGTDNATGSPNVTFGFTTTGAAAFQTLTRTLARRGDLVSGLGQTLDQHGAVTLNGKLVSVLAIDYKAYPDGISGERGADITGGLTTRSARDLATEIGRGAFPIGLRLVSVARTSASDR
jgi:preprotein translocase subunit SecD